MPMLIKKLLVSHSYPFICLGSVAGGTGGLGGPGGTGQGVGGLPGGGPGQFI